MSKLPRASKAQLWERIRNTQELILMDYSTIDIVQSIMTSTGVCERQAKRYYSLALKFLQEKDKQNIEIRKSYYLARKRKLLRNMDPKELRTAAGVTAANKILDSMAKLEGVQVDTVKLIGDKDQPLHTINQHAYSTESVDYNKLPTEFLELIVASRKTA